jgi:hypothetical protein
MHAWPFATDHPGYPADYTLIAFLRQPYSISRVVCYDDGQVYNGYRHIVKRKIAEEKIYFQVANCIFGGLQTATFAGSIALIDNEPP